MERPTVDSAPDVARALTSLVSDMAPAVRLLLGALCYVLGAAVFVQGAFRLVRAADGRPAGPSGTGTVLCFVMSAVLVTLPRWLAAAGESLTFASPDTAALSWGAESTVDWDALLAAVTTVVRLIGIAAVMRGLFVARAAADGAAGATGGSAAAHMVGGVLAWHIVAVIDAVQTSLGIAILDVT